MPRILLTIYNLTRGKARYSEGLEKDNLTAQWKAAHNICSIEALNTAFEDCRDGEAYDLGEHCDILAYMPYRLYTHYFRGDLATCRIIHVVY